MQAMRWIVDGADAQMVSGRAALPLHTNLAHAPCPSAALRRWTSPQPSASLAEKRCWRSVWLPALQLRRENGRPQLASRSWLTEPISTRQPRDPHPTLHNEGEDPALQTGAYSPAELPRGNTEHPQARQQADGVLRRARSKVAGCRGHKKA